MFPKEYPDTPVHWLHDEVKMDNITEKTRDHLVDLYFRFIHDRPHTLFHPKLLRKRVKDQSLPLKVLYSIMALAAR
jgi:hypothetical protein